MVFDIFCKFLKGCIVLRGKAGDEKCAFLDLHAHEQHHGLVLEKSREAEGLAFLELPLGDRVLLVIIVVPTYDIGIVGISLILSGGVGRHVAHIKINAGILLGVAALEMGDECALNFLIFFLFALPAFRKWQCYLISHIQNDCIKRGKNIKFARYLLFLNTKDMQDRKLIQVILPLKLEWEPYYWACGEICRGQRVSVYFSGRRYVAVVDVTDASTDLDPSRIMDVGSYDTGLPPISEKELDFWHFISEYYLCTIGEVYLAAYPHTKIRSEEVAAKAASDAQRRREASREALGKRVEKLITKLEAKDALIASRLSGGRAKSEAITERLRAERGRMADEIAVLLEKIAALDEKPAENNGPQAAIEGAHSPARPVLLISSDRNDFYSKAIAGTLAKGRSALVLTPDTLDCRRLEGSLKENFPELMTVNSGVTPVRRRKISDAVRDGGASVILGTRLSVFLPFGDLGLIIIDNEQDPFYKQSDTAPRYNARDCALMLAQIHGADVVLGTSAPSLESILNTRSGKFSLRRENGGPACLPEIIDLGAEKAKHGVRGIFSYKLMDAVRAAEGKVIMIRGWERPDELVQQASEFFPGKEIEILRYQEAREADLGAAAMVAVLQADALVDKDDFRADERGAQIVAQLASRCRALYVQTAVAARFDGTRSTEDLLKERRDFGFPPYTRMVEYRLKGDGATAERFFLRRDASLSVRKRQIAQGLPEGAYIDVDPQ